MNTTPHRLKSCWFTGLLITACLSSLSLHAATSTFDTAVAGDTGIIDGSFTWQSSEFSEISLTDAATAGLGSGQVLTQAFQTYDGPTGFVGHFWVDLSAVDLSNLSSGDSIQISFLFKTDKPADLDNPGFDRYRWGLFEGATAETNGLGNVFSAGATASRGKIQRYDGTGFFSGESILSDPSLALGADTEFAADDVTINGYLNDSEAHSMDITIAKTDTGVTYTLDIDDGFKVYTAEVLVETYDYTGFESFHFYMRDSTSPDASVAISIDDFTVEVTRSGGGAMPGPVSTFDSATSTEDGIEDGSFLWKSSDFSTVSLDDAAAAGVGSGQVLTQAGELFESPSGLVGHFWTEIPGLNVADMIIGDRIHISFDFKTETPADQDNPGFDRFRWGLFEGLTANSAGVGNIFSSGATASRGKIAVYREAYNDDDSPRFFNGTAILSDPSLALGADTEFAADDVTINGYLGNGEPHAIDITIEKTGTGLHYTFDIDDGLKTYVAEVPLTTHVFTRFNSFQFWMRDAFSGDAARGLSIDNFSIEVTRGPVDSMVESLFDGATVDGENVLDGSVTWGSSTESDLSVVSATDAGFGSGSVLNQANVNYPESGQVGYFWVDLSDLGVTDMKVGESVQVMFTYRSTQPLDMDNPGFDRIRWGLFEEVGGNEWGVGNVFSPGAGASRGKVNYFRETFNDEGDPGFFSNTAVLSDNSLVFGADTAFAADDVGINAYLNDGDPKHIALTFTKTVAGMHIVTNIDQNTKILEAVAPAWAHDFSHFSAFQFYMRAPESSSSSLGLQIENFSAAYASAPPLQGTRTITANFDNASIDEDGKVVTGPELWWSAIENSTLTLINSADAGMGDGGGLVLGQVGEQFEAEPSGSFVTSLAGLGIDNMQPGDEITVSFTIYFPNLAGDDPGWDRYRFGLFETTSSNTFGIGNSFSPGATASRAHISYFKEVYDGDNNPGFLAKEDPISFEDLVEGGDTPFAGDDVTINAFLANGEPHSYQLHLAKVPGGMEVTTTIDDGIVEFSGLIPNATRNFERFGAFRFWMRDGASPTSAQAFFINDFEVTYTPLPVTDDLFAQATSAVAQGDGSFESPWFGGYVRQDGEWILSDSLGQLWVGAVENRFGMWIWSTALNAWFWTSEDTYPQFYNASDLTWYFVFSLEGIGTYVYNYSTRIWSELVIE